MYNLHTIVLTSVVKHPQSTGHQTGCFIAVTFIYTHPLLRYLPSLLPRLWVREVRHNVGYVAPITTLV